MPSFPPILGGYHRYHAFTLLEILVAIAIISTISTLLFPVFARAQNSARRTVCQSNLKQIGLAILQYAQDYDERLPRNDSGKPCLGTWVETTLPYLKSANAFLCPGDTRPFMIHSATKRQTSYALNQIYYQDPKQAIFEANLPGIIPATLAAIEDVVGTIAVGDSRDFYQVSPRLQNNFVQVAFDATPPWMGDGSVRGQFVGRHQNGANWLFLDGHVKWLRLEHVAKRSKSASEELAMLTRTLD